MVDVLHTLPMFSHMLTTAVDDIITVSLSIDPTSGYQLSCGDSVRPPGGEGDSECVHDEDLRRDSLGLISVCLSVSVCVAAVTVGALHAVGRCHPRGCAPALPHAGLRPGECKRDAAVAVNLAAVPVRPSR